MSTKRRPVVDRGEAPVCFGHAVYHHEPTARGACMLHLMKYPFCGGIEPWPCGDHFHIGHTDAATAQACKIHPDNPNPIDSPTSETTGTPTP